VVFLSLQRTPHPDPLPLGWGEGSRDQSLVNSAATTLVCLLLLSFSGCGKQDRIKKGVAELENAFPPATNLAQFPGAATSDRGAAPAAYVQVAMAAVQTNDYAAGVIALQAAQRLSGLVAQQLMAIENAKQAMMTELLTRSSSGDAKAKADLVAIEKTYSQ